MKWWHDGLWLSIYRSTELNISVSIDLHPLNMKKNVVCQCCLSYFNRKGHFKTWLYYVYNFITLYSIRKKDVTTWISKLQFEVDPIVVLQVWIINIPVPPLPKGGCHFIQKLALRFVTEHMFPQALFSGRFLLPQFLLVSSLFTPKTRSHIGIAVFLRCKENKSVIWYQCS